MADVANPFAGFQPDVNRPSCYAFAVTPDDVTDLVRYTRRIYVGGGGTIKVDMIEGGTVTFAAVAAGSTLQVGVKRIYATGTTATLIIGLQ